MSALPSTVPTSHLTLDNYKTMLSSFRVQELQSLLSSCGRCRTGRKNDLLQRAISLVKLNAESSLARKAKSRIIELYKQRYPAGADILFQQHTPITPHPPPYNEHEKLISPLKSPNAMKVTNSMKLNPSPRHTSLTKNTSAVPVHPDVRFKSLPFQELLDTLVRPSSMVQKSLTSFQQMQLTVHLSPHQVQLISHARSYTIQGKVEYSVQVVLRFCLAETSCIQEDLYPSKCTITVNGRHCPLPGFVPTSNQSEPKKPHRAVNITHLCRLSPMSSEQIRINWLPSDSGQRYATTVELVKMILPSVLIQRLKAKAERNADHSRALIKEKLAHDPDSEIATTSLKVSLCCPIGRMKMQYPCRATTCSHVQCFDASLYIQMNERKPSWICPVCDQRAFFENLLIDGLFTEIIRSAPTAEEIVFSQDGSWKPLSDSDEETKFKPTHSKSNTIVLPGTPDNFDNSKQQVSNPQTAQTEKRSDFEVIDLISDDDDDNDNNQSGPRYTSSVASHGSPSTPCYGNTLAGHIDPHGSMLPHPPPLVHADLRDLDGPSNEPLPHSHQQRGRGPRFRHVPAIDHDSLMHMPPVYGSQSLHDLYSILPPSERLTAAMYLNEAGLLMTEGGTSVSDIISLD